MHTMAPVSHFKFSSLPGYTLPFLSQSQPNRHQLVSGVESGPALGRVHPPPYPSVTLLEDLPSSTCSPLRGCHTHRIKAGLTCHVLHPRMLENLDAKTLVVGVRPREVAVGEQTAGVVTAHELELFPVAHGGSVLWNVNLVFSCQGGKGEPTLCSLVLPWGYCGVRLPRGCACVGGCWFQISVPSTRLTARLTQFR